jgi:hypothetical protein
MKLARCRGLAQQTAKGRGDKINGYSSCFEIHRAIEKTAFSATIKYREVAQKCQQNFQEKFAEYSCARRKIC